MGAYPTNRSHVIRPSFLIDFHAIKQQVNILQVLEHYGLMGRLNRNGDAITGTCPIDKRNVKVAFRASIAGNCWNCFNQCGCSGDVFDFVSRKEKVSIPRAARLLVEWFDLRPETPAESTDESSKPSASNATEVMPAPLAPAVNPAATFAVKRYWEMSDTVYVGGKTPDEAIAIAHALPLDLARAEYVPDSMNTDPSTDVHPLLP